MGYAAKDTLKSGNQMLSAQFTSVGQTDGSATLSDLIVSGYEKYDDDTDLGGTSGDLSVQLLTSTGSTEARYYWYDDDERCGWFDRAGAAVDSTVIPAGKGLWVSGSGLQLTSAGAVNKDDVVVVTRKSGNQAIANTTPVSLKLSQLAVTGYDPYDDDKDAGGTSGDFSIQFLTSTGATESRYYWYDDDERTGWFDRSGNSGNDVKLEAGVGVWVSGAGLTVRIPAPEL